MTLHLGQRGPGHQSRVASGVADPGGPENAEAAALFARFEADPGPARRTLIDACIGALKTGGVWAKLDAFYMLAAHDAQAARLNWVQDAFNLQPGGAGTLTFTPDVGCENGGTAAYLDTGFNDLTGSALWTQDAMGAGGYVNAWAGAANYFLGVFGAGNLRIGASATNINTRIHSAGSFNPASPDALPGHVMVVRSGAASSRVLRNGTQVGAVSTAASTAGADANVVGLRSGTAHSADRLACLHLGGELSNTEVADLYAAILTYLTALGAQ
ncbi:hypothetical protein [Phenylobacterium sp. SCN 70-31]|uniref:hypothetical protein n=1 Tax=Phenylobacterium sp. SCN 70-31 TaxID=1660129 RepID=UPI00086AB982|nr:hypothetical protein [Phenylobacterium sp. SCN 70-31]ODT85695.1 MAG: hypothetical protein ABS78_19190 [Phenylobacterium sp. SCN 70-31]